MRVRPEKADHDSAGSPVAGTLECPRCRHPIQRNGHRRNDRCLTCGSPLIPSARKTEAEAWKRLYGKSPVQLH
jgi:hypothetical protein